MYAVFQSGHGWTSLSNAIKTRLVTLERISFAEEALELTSNYVEQILLNDVKRLDHWIHSKKPCKSKSKRTKFY
jgi:hypothetical protein